MHDRAGQGASAFRAFLRGLPDDIAKAREDCLPVVLERERPLEPHAQRLMDTLGVEVRIVSAVPVHADPWNVDEKVARFGELRDELAERAAALPEPPPEFRARVEREIASADARAREDSSSERAVDPEPEEGPRSPTPDAGGLDGQQPPMGARTAEATDATGEPEPRPAPDGARARWDRSAIIAAIVAWNDAHGFPPTSTDWARLGDEYPNAAIAKQVFGGWANAVEAAGFPRPQRGIKPALLADRNPDAANGEATPEERATGPAARSSDAAPVAPDAIGELRTAVLAAVNAMFDVLEKAETVAATR